VIWELVSFLKKIGNTRSYTDVFKAEMFPREEGVVFI
jgi:hypothetical protein